MWVILLVIPNGEICKAKSKGCIAKSEGRRWHYLAVKELPALLRAITSKDFLLSEFH